jgi:hypothetical protein
LSNKIGARLSGSDNAEKAVQYTKAQLETLGIWDFDGKIHELWAEFWNDTGKILKRTLDKYA